MKYKKGVEIKVEDKSVLRSAKQLEVAYSAFQTASEMVNDSRSNLWKEIFLKYPGLKKFNCVFSRDGNIVTIQGKK